MVTIKEALARIDDQVKSGRTETANLSQMVGRVLSETVYAPVDLPPFRQSAMDGFAIYHQEGVLSYPIIGEIAAGSSHTYELLPGEAIRIFTGAHVPDSANAVVMKENCQVLHETLILLENVRPMQHIRNQGDQIKKNATALEKGTHLSPAAVGFLSAMGFENANVYCKPKIAIIATGSELIKPGSPLLPGKIYESNSYMLQAAIEFYRLGESEMFSVHDDLSDTKKTISSALQRADFVLISGGISAGKYDFVARALEEIGITGIFYKVKQKPGKPLYFGAGKTGQYVFALPGNPSAAMTSFLIYILPALRKFAGGGFSGLQKISRKIQKEYCKNDDRTHLLKAFTDEHTVQIMDGQNSDILMSFAHANAIAVIPDDCNSVSANETIEIFLL